MIYNVGSLFREATGSNYVYDVDFKLNLEKGDGVVLKSNVVGSVKFTRVEDGVLAEVRDLSVDVEFECTRCNIRFTKQIQVEFAARVYYFEEQENVTDLMDIFYVDMKDSTINIEDFIRQEIILHFPQIPVHSNSCKGLCPTCGTNLNDKSCDCVAPETAPEKPLAILKQLYNAKTSSSKEENSEGSLEKEI